ncbi:MAG: hypothetical protein LAN71_02230 [Acidobacteriia bacterium]|nr:hypothetical protein [Terriglobia bacterium]
MELVKRLLEDWRLAALAAGAALLIFGSVVYALFRSPEDTEEAERRRRLHLNRIGRIAEGQIVDLVEQAEEIPAARGGLFRSNPAAGKAPLKRKHVWYSYSISGVTYQTAQDITGLDSQVQHDRLVPGHPASVKYDAANPTNSILVADDWSGLR